MDFLLWLQQIRTPVIEDIALVISLLCDKILIMLVFCWIFWCRDKRSAYGLALSFAISGIMVQGLKLSLRVNRPFIRDSRIKPVDRALETATGYSFPSGHTQIATSLLGYAALLVKNNAVRILSVLMIALVMLSRMVLGVHTPLDVTVSFLITAVTAFAVRAVLNKDGKVGLLPGLCVSVAFFAYSIFLVLSGRVEYALAHDGIVTSIVGIAFFVCRYIESNFIRFDPAATFSGKSGIGHQLLKFAVGFVCLIAIYLGLGCFDNAVMDGIKYVAVFTWICALYPLVIKKLCKRV